MSRLGAAGLALTLLATLPACTSGAPGVAPPPAAPATPTAAPTATPAPTATAAPDDLPPVTHRVSLPALMREEFVAGRVRQGEVESRNEAYMASSTGHRTTGRRST